MFRSILSSDPLIHLPSNPEELAEIIFNNSVDWALTLDFLDRYTKTKGIEINALRISLRSVSLVPLQVSIDCFCSSFILL